MLNSLDHHELLVFWVQLLALYATARVFGAVARRLGLPSVVGELSAGVVLGPSLFGVLWPSGFDWFLPESEVQSAMLLAVSWFCAAFLLVVAGFETDLELIKRLGRAAALVTVGSVLAPFAGGLFLGARMPQTLYGESADSTVFTLFVATAVAVSALAVVAKILADLGLMRRDVGQITIAAGMANDLIGWVILGVIAALAVSGQLSAWDISKTAIGLTVFFVASLTVGQRAVDIGLRAARRSESDRQGALTVILGTMFVLGVVTQWLGLEAVLGAFVAGVLVARSRYQQIEGEHVIEDLTSVVFAPLFFATAGLRLDLGLLRGDTLQWALWLLLAALTLKFAGSFIGARVAGLTVREGLVLGAGLNARGALEIIIASVGLSLGVLNQTSFTMIVMIPLVTSLFASVALRILARDLEGSVVERERLATEAALENNVLVRNNRILIPPGTESNGVLAAQIAHFAWPESLAATVMAIDTGNGDSPEDIEPLRNVLYGRDIDVRAVPLDAAAELVVNEAKLGYGVVAVGTVAEPGHGVFFSPLVDEILGRVDLPVVIVRKARNLPGRLPGAFARALVPVVASESSRAAEELAANFASRLGTQLMLSHVVYQPRGTMHGQRLLGLLKDVAFPEDVEVAEKVLARAQRHALDVQAVADTEIRFASSPAEEIVRHANDIEADLIVIGAQLRNLEGRPSLGPNAEHVLEHAPQTVVAVVMPDRRPS